MGSVLAYFEDTEASADNNFEVGTWAVSANGGGSTAAFILQEPAAGAQGTHSWAVTNTGSVPAYVDMSVSVAVTGNVTMADYVLIHLYVAGYVGSIYGSGDSFLPINGAAGAHDTNLLLAPGNIINIALDWKVSEAYVPNTGDKVVLNMNFNIKPAP